MEAAAFAKNLGLFPADSGALVLEVSFGAFQRYLFELKIKCPEIPRSLL